MTWLSFSMSVTSSPRCAKFSTISRPMNPPPTTTARLGLVTVWNPVYESIPVFASSPRWSHARMTRASGTVLTEKIPGESMPGSGGRMGAAPGDSTSVS